MSYEQLETRLKALVEQSKRLQINTAQMQGAHKELVFMTDQMLPGLDHELMEKRRGKIEQSIAQTQAEFYQVQGALKEMQYWLHMTPDGQKPNEAILQLLGAAQNTSDQSLPSEGPRTELEALMHGEYQEWERNGAQPLVLVKEG